MGKGGGGTFFILLSLEGWIVTADALHCNRAFAPAARRSRVVKNGCAIHACVPNLNPWGRGNSEAIANRSSFALDLELGAFQYLEMGAYEIEDRGAGPFACRIFVGELCKSTWNR
jgi:predicted transposase YbfD/YdcC